MANLVPHPTGGNRVRYQVHFPDGSYVNKQKYRKLKGEARSLLIDAERLEGYSRKGSLTRDETIYFVNKKLLSPDEAVDLCPGYTMAGSSEVTWGDLLERFEKDSENSEEIRARTRGKKINKIKTVISLFNEKGLNPADVKKAHVEEFLDDRKAKKIKAATRRKDLDAIRCLLDYIDEDNNPAREVKPPKINDEILPRPFAYPELVIFMNTLRRPEFRSLLYGCAIPSAMLYLYAGLRPEEQVNLTRADVDLHTFKIGVQAKGDYTTKTGKARGVDMHPKLRFWIRRLLIEKGKYLLGGNRKLNAEHIGQAISKIIKRANLEGVTPYSLRHSFCSYLLDAGANLVKESDQAGHTIRTAQRYLKVVRDEDSPVHRIKFGKRP